MVIGSSSSLLKPNADLNSSWVAMTWMNFVLSIRSISTEVTAAIVLSDTVSPGSFKQSSSTMSRSMSAAKFLDPLKGVEGSSESESSHKRPLSRIQQASALRPRFAMQSPGGMSQSSASSQMWCAAFFGKYSCSRILSCLILSLKRSNFNWECNVGGRKDNIVCSFACVFRVSNMCRKKDFTEACNFSEAPPSFKFRMYMRTCAMSSPKRRLRSENLKNVWVMRATQIANAEKAKNMKTIT
mmetsp:Transcript_84924/g.166176  ORF Transcript_84924/g.166176 Transcript_84924/m.166176 type:complete len:241 (-) Transcript_84924:521-1243(-)